MQSFPFDSELTYDEHDNPIYDRAISSQPLRKLIRELFTTGVMPNPSTSFQVSAGNDGMTVQIAGGFAVIDGGLCHETETRTLEVTAADNTYDRIDTVVLRWNENVDVRTADLYVIAGTPAVNPVRPTLQRNNSIYEIGLADVFITKRVATITNDKITDTRYEADRCGIVSSISQFDTTTLYQQVQADLAYFKSDNERYFNQWFEGLVNILDTNAAGHLQNEIDSINTTITSIGSQQTSQNTKITALENSLKDLDNDWYEFDVISDVSTDNADYTYRWTDSASAAEKYTGYRNALEGREELLVTLVDKYDVIYGMQKIISPMSTITKGFSLTFTADYRGTVVGKSYRAEISFLLSKNSDSMRTRTYRSVDDGFLNTLHIKVYRHRKYQTT